MQPRAFNSAEAIIEPFWDPQLSGLSQWTVADGAAHGLRIYQNWCWAGFEWARKPASGPALRMSRRFEIDLREYDRLVVSVMAPTRSILRVIAHTDLGERPFEAPPAPALKKEHALDLRGAARLQSLTIEIDASADGIAEGWFNWIGLQNSRALPSHLAQREHFNPAWEPYLRPEDYEPRFEPMHGLLIGRRELDDIRRRHERHLAEHGDSPFVRMGREAAGCVPEQMVRDFVNFWGDTRYCRERDHGNQLLTRGLNAAIAGLLLRDRHLLRLGARYAMALAMCGRWDDGMICHFPGSPFEHRCFVQSLCIFETALILDLAGEWFTDIGRDFLMRRIAEEGLGAIHFNTWKHEYIFHCNQLAWFTPGRMLGCLLLEKHWPRVKPYTRLAYQDLNESLGDAILPDGGYVEGPTYFTCVGRDAGLSLYLYARARRRKFDATVPPAMRQTGDFGAAVASTDAAQDVIPICDAVPTHSVLSLAVMASVLPRSQWAAMFHKALQRGNGMPPVSASAVSPMADGLLALHLGSSIPADAPPPPPFVYLPDMGLAASTRRSGPDLVKVLIMGNKAGAGHTHEDKGSFVLEFAGETFAMDPGTTDYSSPLAGELQNCERHNMLVPFGTAERPHPQCPLQAEVRPRCQGDEIRFRATIDATPGWEPYYSRWARTWDAPQPDALTITDEWELKQGSGVVFLWQTRLPALLDGRTLTLKGRRGVAHITVPDGCQVNVEERPLAGDAVQRRIAIRDSRTAGRLVIQVRLVGAEGARQP